MRITLFIGALGAGGAERALVVLSEGLSNLGHDVTILTWLDHVPDFYAIPEKVTREHTNLPDNLVSTRWFDIPGGLKRLQAIRKAIAETNPDVAISFLDGNNELFLLASAGKKYKKILSCQNDMHVHQHFNPRWDKLRSVVYKAADKIVFLDEDQAKREAEVHSGWHCTGIPNPVVDVNIEPDQKAGEVISTLQRYPVRLVAMGRLVPQKGFDLLLRAYEKIHVEFPDSVLVILGEGEERESLNQQIVQLGLDGNVYLPGLLVRPHSVISHCDLFLFSSRYEGQGLALVEAMACGVPAVSFDCPSGPSYIIDNMNNGILVPPEDVDLFAESVINLLGDRKKLAHLSENTTVVKNKYSVNKICDQWIELISSL